MPHTDFGNILDTLPGFIAPQDGHGGLGLPGMAVDNQPVLQPDIFSHNNLSQTFDYSGAGTQNPFDSGIGPLQGELPSNGFGMNLMTWPEEVVYPQQLSQTGFQFSNDSGVPALQSDLYPIGSTSSGLVENVTGQRHTTDTTSIASPGNESAASEIWKQLVNDPMIKGKLKPSNAGSPSTIPNTATSSSVGTPRYEEQHLQSHGNYRRLAQSPLAYIMQDLSYNAHTDQYQPAAPVIPSSTPSSASTLGAMASLSNYSSPARSSKRSRETPGPFYDSSVIMAASPAIDVNDPKSWQLWDPNQPRQAVGWARRDTIQEQIADKTLGMALSQHLIKVFFQSVHLTLPVSPIPVWYALSLIIGTGLDSGSLLYGMATSWTENGLHATSFRDSGNCYR